MPTPAPNSKSFARLWVTAQPVVSAYVQSAVRHAADAEDLVQDVAEASFADFHQYDPAKSFTAWALGIARHRILNHFRTNRRHQHVMGGETLAVLAETHLEVSDREEDHQAALRRCMSKLTEKQQSLLRLRYCEDRSPSAIAGLSKTSARSIVNTLYHIRRKLADCIQRQLDSQGEVGRG